MNDVARSARIAASFGVHGLMGTLGAKLAWMGEVDGDLKLVALMQAPFALAPIAPT
ncbi:hypothetical protein [Pseudorhodoferax sp.]|jgi:hypothetical protein|uniref:hypothetical protein n=1 Tax=Pseudorhodoferax sp. TaxID=1993553 RepID=UPI002DD67C32|nr:hypothetical protein [Pseudorhodoferax sp.]